MMVLSEKCWEESNIFSRNNFPVITWDSYVHFTKRTTHLHKEKALYGYQILDLTGQSQAKNYSPVYMNRAQQKNMGPAHGVGGVCWCVR